MITVHGIIPKFNSVMDFVFGWIVNKSSEYDAYQGSQHPEAHGLWPFQEDVPRGAVRGAPLTLPDSASTDCGWLRQMAHSGHTGTLRYMAPEVVAQRTGGLVLLF